MGGGSSKSSSSNRTYDNDIMVGEEGMLLQAGASYEQTSIEDGKIIEAGGVDDSISANSIESVKKNSENVSVSNGGTGNTTNITHFGENAAQTVRRAIDTLGSVTSKNIQLYTDKDLLSDKLAAEKTSLSGEEIKSILSLPGVQIGLAATGAIIVWWVVKGRKKK
jgi:hypothetical protein